MNYAPQDKEHPKTKMKYLCIGILIGFILILTLLAVIRISNEEKKQEIPESSQENKT